MRIAQYAIGERDAVHPSDLVRYEPCARWALRRACKAYRTALAKAAAQSAPIEVIRAVFRYARSSVAFAVEAAAAGREDAVAWWFDCKRNRGRRSAKILIAAAGSGCIGALDASAPATGVFKGLLHITRRGAHYGHVSVVRWCVARSSSPGVVRALCGEAMRAFCQNDNADGVSWCLSAGARAEDAVSAACKHGAGAVMARLLESGVRPHSWDVLAAVGRGMIGVLESLRSAGVIEVDVAALACETDRVDVLDWCLRSGVPHNLPEYFACAARNASHSSMTWLVRNHCAPTEAGLVAAAAAGPDTVRHALLLRAPLSPEACRSAARTGSLCSLKVLREAGCPWDSRTLYAALSTGHDSLAAWARANGCPGGAADVEG
jgi:hypothetical protein